MTTHIGTSLKAAQHGSKGFEMRNSGKYTHELAEEEERDHSSNLQGYGMHSACLQEVVRSLP